jgi:hypothetical protein
MHMSRATSTEPEQVREKTKRTVDSHHRRKAAACITRCLFPPHAQRPCLSASQRLGQVLGRENVICHVAPSQSSITFTVVQPLVRVLSATKFRIQINGSSSHIKPTAARRTLLREVGFRPGLRVNSLNLKLEWAVDSSAQW